MGFFSFKRNEMRNSTTRFSVAKLYLTLRNTCRLWKTNLTLTLVTAKPKKIVRPWRCRTTVVKESRNSLHLTYYTTVISRTNKSANSHKLVLVCCWSLFNSFCIFSGKVSVQRPLHVHCQDVGNHYNEIGHHDHWLLNYTCNIH